MNQPDIPDIEESLHLRDYLRPILKHRWLVFAFFTILVAATTIASFRMKPIYQATMQLLIDKENPNVVNIQEVLAMNTADLDYYQTQYEILKNRSLIKRAIETLDLTHDPELNPPPEEKGVDFGRLKAAMVGWLQGMLSSDGAVPSSEDSASTLENQMTAAYMARLKVNSHPEQSSGQHQLREP